MKNRLPFLARMRKQLLAFAACASMAFLSAASPLTIQAKAGADFREWKQKDPEFNKEPAWPVSLTGTQDYYLGQFGCLVSSISMLLRHYDLKPSSDIGFTPYVCSRELLQAGLFDRLCNLRTEQVEKAYPNFRYKGRAAYTPEKLAELYNKGYACIAIVLNYGHYVAIDDGSVPGVATIFDPDSDYRFLNQYDKIDGILYFEMTGSKRPDFSPFGELTECAIDDHHLRLNGYAYDRDASTVSVDVYVADQKIGTIKTSTPNEKITEQFKVSDKPGFEASFDLNAKLSGWQPLKLVARNTGRQGETFDTVIADERIYVGKDTTAPQIGNESLFRRGAILEINADVSDDYELSTASLVAWNDDRAIGDFSTFELFENPQEVKDGKVSVNYIPASEGEWKFAIAARDKAGNVTVRQIGSSTYQAEDASHTIYRLYNPNDGDHHYTMSLGEKNALVDLGWHDEGIGWLSDPAQTVPIYRQYNPNAKAGSHNYTPSLGEHNALGDKGWHKEGTAWYALSAPNR